MHSKKLITHIFAAILIAATLLGCSRPSAKTGKMVVAASIAPLANFCKEVGGNYVKVELLVPPGSNPHTYQVQPDQMEMLSNASVLVLNGVGLEFWAKNVTDAADNHKLIVTQTAAGLPVIDHGDEEGGNPHVWVDPIDAIHQVNAIRDAFAKADPTHAKQYSQNAARYVTKLKQLDTYIRSQVSDFRSRSFISFHPTWVYFSKRYGLKEAAVIESSPGKEPAPDDIRQVIDTAKRLRVKAIFAEPQVYPKAAYVVAEEVGAKIVTLDAFGKPPSYDYIAMMKSNINAMAGAMK